MYSRNTSLVVIKTTLIFSSLSQWRPLEKALALVALRVLTFIYFVVRFHEICLPTSFHRYYHGVDLSRWCSLITTVIS